MKKIIYLPITTDMPREQMLKLAEAFTQTMKQATGKRNRFSSDRQHGKSSLPSNKTPSAGEDVVEDIWDEEEAFLIPADKLNSRL